MTSSAVEILDAADRIRSGAGLERGLALAALGAASDRPLEDLPLGALHERVLAVREALSGPALIATATCPSCGELVEFELAVDALRTRHPDGPTEGRFRSGDIEVSWRVPTVADLQSAAEEADAGTALRERCLAAFRGSEPIAMADIPSDALAEAEAAMAAADPLAELLVALECPACRTGFDADVDPIAFVGVELGAASARILRGIHDIATVYGWSEADILALPDGRREAYLALIRGGGP
jgi:hypothetical protein